MALVEWIADGQNQAGGVMDVFRGQIRAVLRSRGFDFCDETDGQALDLGDLAAQNANATATALRNQSLIEKAISASSTDADNQSIANTVADDDEFWSSTGRPTPDGTQSLTYKLRDPLCVLRAVTIAVYRARYQFGEPVYPPLRVSFQVGPSPQALHSAGPVQEVAPAEWPQTFLLPDAPVGGFLRITMHGRRQRQLEDLQFYLAIRHVDAHGVAVSPLAVSGYRQLLRSANFQLPRGFRLPASAVLPGGICMAESDQRRRKTMAAATHAAARRVFLEEPSQQGGNKQSVFRARIAAFGWGLFGFGGSSGSGSAAADPLDAQAAPQTAAGGAEAGTTSPAHDDSAQHGNAAAGAAAAGSGGGGADGSDGETPLFTWVEQPPDSGSSSDEDGGTPSIKDAGSAMEEEPFGEQH